MYNGFIKHEIILNSYLPNGKNIKHKYDMYDLFHSWVNIKDVLKETLKENENRLLDEPN